MRQTKLDERFMGSTRGRIVTLLRDSPRTVEELAALLELTDNAVRAHLATLERDGLAEQSGVRRGPRKPHFTYSLTPEAEGLFPKAYDALLIQLITTLKGRLSPPAVEDVLREVGRTIAERHSADGTSADLDERLRKALEVLKAIGGAPEVAREGDRLTIRSGGCPLAAAVVAHPEVCELAEALVAELVGLPVKESCDRGASPRCRFEIEDPA